MLSSVWKTVSVNHEDSQDLSLVHERNNEVNERFKTWALQILVSNLMCARLQFSQSIKFSGKRSWLRVSGQRCNSTKTKRTSITPTFCPVVLRNGTRKRWASQITRSWNINPRKCRTNTHTSTVTVSLPAICPHGQHFQYLVDIQLIGCKERYDRNAKVFRWQQSVAQNPTTTDNVHSHCDHPHEQPQSYWMSKETPTHNVTPEVLPTGHVHQLLWTCSQSHCFLVLTDNVKKNMTMNM